MEEHEEPIRALRSPIPHPTLLSAARTMSYATPRTQLLQLRLYVLAFLFCVASPRPTSSINKNLVLPFKPKASIHTINTCIAAALSRLDHLTSTCFNNHSSKPISKRTPHRQLNQTSPFDDSLANNHQKYTLARSISPEVRESICKGGRSLTGGTSINFIPRRCRIDNMVSGHLQGKRGARLTIDGTFTDRF